jgi:hypothetical protein
MIFVFLGAPFQRRGELATENLALSQQLGVLEHMYKRPRLRMTPIKGGGIAPRKPFKIAILEDGSGRGEANSAIYSPLCEDRAQPIYIK